MRAPHARIIEPEILDELPADDPRAIQSRRDLRKINRLMGHAGLVTHALRAAPSPPRLIVELGSGDGSFLLRIVRRLAPQTGTRAVLVDRRPSVSAATRERFAAAGWAIDVCEADVFEWLCRAEAGVVDATIANLFLHHFRDAALARLLNLVAQQSKRFIACEPSRSRVGLAAIPLLRGIGCNDVTLHDGNRSVLAGFRDRELSALWPSDAAWKVIEGPRGLFTHAFVAARDASPTAAPPSRESRTSG